VKLRIVSALRAAQRRARVRHTCEAAHRGASAQHCDALMGAFPWNLSDAYQ
jgi:hypothetical protein